MTLRSHHSFTDGNFGLKLLAHLVIASFDPDAYDRLPDTPMDYGLPIWRIAWNTPRQGMNNALELDTHLQKQRYRLQRHRRDRRLLA